MIFNGQGEGVSSERLAAKGKRINGQMIESHGKAQANEVLTLSDQ